MTRPLEFASGKTRVAVVSFSNHGVARFYLDTYTTRMYTPYAGSNLANQINRKLGVFDRKPEENMYTPYEGSNLTNQINRKLGVFERKLEGSHTLFY